MIAKHLLKIISLLVVAAASNAQSNEYNIDITVKSSYLAWETEYDSGDLLTFSPSLFKYFSKGFIGTNLGGVITSTDEEYSLSTVELIGGYYVLDKVAIIGGYEMLNIGFEEYYGPAVGLNIYFPLGDAKAIYGNFVFYEGDSAEYNHISRRLVDIGLAKFTNNPRLHYSINFTYQSLWGDYFDSDVQILGVGLGIGYLF